MLVDKELCFFADPKDHSNFTSSKKLEAVVIFINERYRSSNKYLRVNI